MFLFSIYGFNLSLKFKYYPYKNLLFLLKINLVFYLFFVIIEILLGQSIDYSLQYYFLAPFCIFVFLKIDETHFLIALNILLILLSISIFNNFLETLSGSDGIENVLQYHIKLRPDLFENLSRSGDFFRVGGYTGSYHDSANILGLLVTFLFIRFLIKGNLILLFTSIIGFTALLITQSAANIVFTIITILFFSIFILYKSNSVKKILIFSLIFISLISLIYKFADLTLIFTTRLSKDEGDWQGVQHGLTLNYLFKYFIFILLGHGNAFGADIIRVEVSLIKQIVQFGIIQALTFFRILLDSLFVNLKSNNKEKKYNNLPFIASIFFGFISLIHYGSLIRITSIFLFLSFASFIYKSYTPIKN